MAALFFPTNSSVQRDFHNTNTDNQTSLTIPRVFIATFPVKSRGSLAYDIPSRTLWYSDGVSWSSASSMPIPVVPDINVYPIKPAGSQVYDLATNTVWYSTGTAWQPMTTTPVVPDVSVYPILQQGTMVYDLATNTLWYSDGVSWIQSAKEKVLQSTLTIYANAATGSDSNDGLTPGTAVETIQKGLDIMSGYLANTGVLQLQGATDFALGADPVLNLFPCTSAIGEIIIRGTQVSTVTDTVLSIPSPSGTGPFDSWRVVNGTAGGYPVSFYSEWFIRNDTQDRVYVVSDNAASSVDTITGDDAIVDGKGDSWLVGDTFTLFRTEQTITFSGNLRVINPSNSNLKFEYLTILPAAGGVWNNAGLPVTTFRGSRMMSASNRSYIGGMSIEGCYSENIGGSTKFTAYDDPSPKTFNSMWLNGPSVELTGPSIANFVNIEDCTDPDFAVFISSNLQGTSLNITGNNAYYGVYVGDYYLNPSGQPAGGNAVFSNVNIENAVGIGTGNLIFVGDSKNSTITITNFRGRDNSASPNTALDIGYGGGMTLYREIDVIGTGQLIAAYADSSLTISVNDTVSFVSTGTDVLAGASENSKIVISGYSGSLTFSRTASTFFDALVSVTQGSLFLLSENDPATYSFIGNTAVAILFASEASRIEITGISFGSTTIITNTNPSGRGVYCKRGSIYISTVLTSITYSTIQLGAPTKATVVLESCTSCAHHTAITDLTATQLLICGNNSSIAGPGSTSTPQNDFAIATPQNCFITFH